MMLLAELARKEGLFDFVAGPAARLAGGSATKLFALVYRVGTVVPIFMSNDATAVVLTPAVFAATKAAKVRDPLPYLLICALIAIAASFVLPISNPANLIVRGPCRRCLIARAVRIAIGAVDRGYYTVLRFTQRNSLRQKVMAAEVDASGLTASGIVGMGVVLLLVSGFGVDLGLPHLSPLSRLLGGCAFSKARVTGVTKDISWKYCYWRPVRWRPIAPRW